MKNWFTVIVVISCTLLFFRHPFAEELKSENVIQSKSKKHRVEIRRIGEGRYDVFLIDETLNKETKIWESFWGNINIKYSDKDNYFALQDGMRFGVMSPIVLFKIKGETPIPIYQTPGSFRNEETHFDYQLGEFSGDTFEIKVLFNEWIENSSRPIQIYKFSYYVKNLEKKKGVKPNFYE